MKRIFTAFLTLVCGIALSGCADMNKQDIGVLTGGVAGGLLGNTIGQGNGRILAVVGGTVAGAMIGGAIGHSMDETDKLKVNQALESNNVGQPAYWQNAKTGADYRVTPTKNVTVRGNKYCREYRTTANIAGKVQQMYGTACRQPDGSWKQVS
jgi:surface antigen